MDYNYYLTSATNHPMSELEVAERNTIVKNRKLRTNMNQVRQLIFHNWIRPF